MFNGFIFDLDGTVYLGERLIPGADRIIRLLREGGRKVVFLSNKPLYTREDYAAKLTRLGIPTAPSEVVNSRGRCHFCHLVNPPGGSPGRWRGIRGAAVIVAWNVGRL